MFDVDLDLIPFVPGLKSISTEIGKQHVIC
jgi:hypothetical protein